MQLSDDEAARRVLTDDEVLQLANLALRVEKHYGEPQDMEWAFANGQFYLVQTRPITTLADARRRNRQGARDRPGCIASHGEWQGARVELAGPTG